MKRLIATVASVVLLATVAQAQEPRWTVLVDGKSMGNFTRVGTANWRVEGGAIVADKLEGKDPAYLVTKTKYKNFQIHSEFWSDEETNSGIFIRCSDPAKIDAKLCYEVNIFDKRPDPSYGTGAIVDVAKVIPMPKAAGKWNDYDITAYNNHFTVIFNGQKTVDVDDTRLPNAGNVGLQYGSGVIKFRKVLIRELK
ncbi:MAG TPA: DUF1080 domain-containing protein [Reyranella sp.]|nr:DUF1080 domain-containing protein [Reyranella sp.]